jgi:hypothetical protein
LLREMVGYVAQRLMELDVEGLCGAAHGERSGERENWRNGFRDRVWETRAGTIPLRIPKLRLRNALAYANKSQRQMACCRTSQADTRWTLKSDTPRWKVPSFADGDAWQRGVYGDQGLAPSRQEFAGDRGGDRLRGEHRAPLPRAS